MNTANGLVLWQNSTALGAWANANGRDGIQVNGVCAVNWASAFGNGTTAADGAGIRVNGDKNRIERTTVKLNDVGIKAGGMNNLIIGNAAGGNTLGNFDAAPGNTVGPSVTRRTSRPTPTPMVITNRSIGCAARSYGEG